MSMPRPPFPESVRRRPIRRRRHGTVAGPLLVVLAVMLLLPRWTVRRVLVPSGAPGVLRTNLRSLAGLPMAWLDLAWVRRSVEVWPGVEAAEVRRELDGTLRVRWSTPAVAASLRTGRGWHAICADGTPGPRLELPVPPVLETPPGDAAATRRVLAAVHRLQEHGLGPVRRVRLVLPGEIEAWSGPEGRTIRILAAVRGSRSELAAPGLLAAAGGASFLDVTRDDRLVIGPRRAVGS